MIVLIQENTDKAIRSKLENDIKFCINNLAIT